MTKSSNEQILRVNYTKNMIHNLTRKILLGIQGYEYPENKKKGCFSSECFQWTKTYFLLSTFYSSTDKQMENKI